MEINRFSIELFNKISTVFDQYTQQYWKRYD